MENLDYLYLKHLFKRTGTLVSGPYFFTIIFNLYMKGGVEYAF